MSLTTDEQAMRNALLDLAGGQPDAPVDRLDGVRRRHRRRGAAQSIGAALGVAALVGGGLTLTGGVRTTHHHRPSIAATPALPWQLSWPERSDGTVDKQRVLSSVHAQASDDLGHVRWLYDGTAPDTITKFGLLEADFPSDPAPMIRAHALFAVISHDGGDTWSVQQHDAPAATTPVIGVADQRGHTVFALAAPGVGSIELVNVHKDDGVDTDPLPVVADSVTVFTASTALADGSAFLRPEGAPSMFAVLFADDAQAQGGASWLNSEPPRVHGEHPFGTMSGGAGGGFTQKVDYTGTLIYKVRCAGPVPLRLTVTTPRASQDINVDRCDGLFHEFVGPQIARGQKLHTDISGDQGETLAVISVSVRS